MILHTCTHGTDWCSHVGHAVQYSFHQYTHKLSFSAPSSIVSTCIDNIVTSYNSATPLISYLLLTQLLTHSYFVRHISCITPYIIGWA